MLTVTLSRPELERRAAEAHELLGERYLVCPRSCKVDRRADVPGLCAIGRHAVVASHFPHFGEEDCLRGRRGSGTIFFSGCNLRCVFCQNHDISWELRGELVTPKRLAEMMLDLQALGCHNINFVTPEHVVPQILEALHGRTPNAGSAPSDANASTGSSSSAAATSNTSSRPIPPITTSTGRTAHLPSGRRRTHCG